MSIEKEIFTEFFKRLSEDPTIPVELTAGLKSLYESGQLDQPNAIINTVKKLIEDAK